MSKLFSQAKRLPTIKNSLSPTVKKTLPICGVICFLIICLVSNPQKYIQSVKDGLLLFANNVAPALFPFFFFTKLLTGLGFADYLGKVGGKPLQKLYNCPKCSSYVFMMSVVSGYPVGSKLISDLHGSNLITTKDAKSISSFTSTSGPLFVVGTVGTLMLGSPVYGYICFCCHLLGSLTNGLIYRQKDCQNTISTALPHANCNHDKLLGDSINSSIISVLAVGGYIAIFSMVVDVLASVGLIALLSKPLAGLLSLFNQPPEIAKGVIICCIEITRGCYELSKCGVDIVTLLPYVTAMLSFGGLSICMQSSTFLNSCGVKTSYFLLTKLTQALVTFAITFFLCMLL